MFDILELFDQELKKSNEFILHYKSLWADNGDCISKFYAGTDSLNSDVTRDGKQNILNIIDS